MIIGLITDRLFKNWGISPLNLINHVNKGKLENISKCTIKNLLLISLK